MIDFTTVLNNAVVAISPTGVKQNCNYLNINGCDLLPMLRVVKTGDKDGSHFLRTDLSINEAGSCNPRGNQNTNSVASLIIIDADKRVTPLGEIIEGAPNPFLIHKILFEMEIGHILYGSYSHYAGDRGNRYRIILSTSTPYTKEQLKPTLESIFSLINSRIDDDMLIDVTENCTWSQPWYFPRKPTVSQGETLYLENLMGNPISVVQPLPVPPISNSPPQGAVSNTSGISPIQAFNEQNSIIDVLKRYGYKKVYAGNEHEKWLSPNSKSRIAGITVKDNKIFSHHSDKLHDGYWHDAFDLMKTSERLSANEAIIKAARDTLAPDGRTVDEYNKSLFNASKQTNYKTTLQQEHTAILKNLLARIPRVDFRVRAELKDDKSELRRSHFYITAIEVILETAKKNNWGMCRNHDFIYLYNGTYWSLIDEDELKSFLGNAAEKMGMDRYFARDYTFREQLYKQFLTLAHLPKPERDKDVTLINLQNGTFEITTAQRQLKPFDQASFLTYQLPFAYDPMADCPVFQGYLDKVLPDVQLQNILAEYIGYIFIRTKTLKLEKALILYGTGANGKSVFYEVIRSLLGENNTSEYSLQSLTDDKGYQRAMIANKLVNYASEISGKLETAIFKQLVSGEPVEARLPYGHPFSITDYAKLIFNCNELPKDVEQSEAYFRRFLIIPFQVTIDEREQDKQLAKKIIESELSGIFNWVLSGLNRLLIQKQFTDSNIIRQARADYEKESDSVRLFLEEAGYSPSIDHHITVTELYAEYRRYCQDNGYHPVTKHNFKKRLERAKIIVDRKSVGNVAYVAKSNSYSAGKWGE